MLRSKGSWRRWPPMAAMKRKHRRGVRGKTRKPLLRCRSAWLPSGGSRLEVSGVCMRASFCFLSRPTGHSAPAAAAALACCPCLLTSMRRTARTPTLRLPAWPRCAAGEGEEEGSEEDEEEEGRELDPEAAARVRAEVQRLLEEYYKLNYEDVVGGVPTRFR